MHPEKNSDRYYGDTEDGSIEEPEAFSGTPQQRIQNAIDLFISDGVKSDATPDILLELLDLGDGSVFKIRILTQDEQAHSVFIIQIDDVKISADRARRSSELAAMLLNKSNDGKVIVVFQREEMILKIAEFSIQKPESADAAGN